MESDNIYITTNGSDNMKYEINSLHHGFKLHKKYEINELNAMAHIFKHEKSGAQLLYLKNDDDNKVFSAAFRTPPSDSTGVPHIVEHCVLSGSRKYKTKEPFMDMVKGSLKTFINAMTFSDKTIYPVASRNSKDFFNLVDVYLDSVFFPMIHEDKTIFMQEGWHYDISDRKDPLKYTGVVYNEMLGAYSTPESILDDVIDESLYPDTCYKYSSGGNPDHIPDLTLEGFTDFHKKYYHPSNSYLYLYGDMDLDMYLKHINEDYLQHFDVIQVDSVITPQTKLSERTEVTAHYPIAASETTDNKDYLSLSYNFGTATDTISYLTAQILKHSLITSTAAPVKKALIDAGIGEDISASTSDGIHNGISIIAKNTSDIRKHDFVNVIETTLMQLVKKGIDKELLQSSINIVEYDMRETSRFATKGIIYHINSMQSWLYGDDATVYLQYDPLLKELRDLLDTDHYEKFVEKYFLNNNHRALISLKPQPGLAEEKIKALTDKLQDYKDTLSNDELDSFIEDKKKLNDKQTSPDSAKALATIPQLEVSDVDKDEERIPQDVQPHGPATLLYHDIFSNDIGYIDFVFDMKPLSLELVPYANLLTSLITKMDTNQRSYDAMTNEIFKYTGGVTLQTVVYPAGDTDQTFYPRLAVRSKAIGENIGKVNSILKELLVDSNLTDKKRLKEILQLVKSRTDSAIIQNGHTYAGRRAASYQSPYARYNEVLTGLEYFWFISDLLENFDEKSDEIIENIQKVYKQVFNVNNLVMSFTGSQQDFTRFKSTIDTLNGSLNQDLLEPQNHVLKADRVNEGIITSGNVQYVAKSANYRKYGYTYNGDMNVLIMIANSEFLHDRVRAKGGAYGCSMSISQTGNIVMSSYRDPNLKETLAVYDELPEFVENLDISQEEMTKFIIGAISKIDAAMTAHMKGRTATANYISKITHEELQEERNEILATTPDQLKKYGPMLRQMLAENHRCVVGTEVKINEQSEVFDHIVPLKK